MRLTRIYEIIPSKLKTTPQEIALFPKVTENGTFCLL